MPLQDQVVPIEIATGIDTKTDPKKVTGKLISLINAVFKESKALLKRYGFASLPQTILGGSSIAQGATVSPYQSELVVLDGKNLYSYSDQQAEWVNKGPSVSCTISTTSIVKNSRGQVTQDQAIHSSGFQVFTWEDSSGGSAYSVIDTGTGQTIVNGAVLSATGYVAKPIAVGNYIVIFYYDTANTSLTYKAINMSTPTAIGSAVVIGGSPNLFNVPAKSCIYDATLINSIIHIVFSNTTGIACYTLNSSLTLTNPRTITATQIQNLAVFGDASNNVWIGSFQTVANVSVAVYSNAFAALVLTNTALDGSSNFTTLRNLSGIVIGTTGYLFYESDQSNVFANGNIVAFYGNYIRSCTCTITGTVGTPYNVIRSLGLASKPFIYSGIIYMLSVYDAKRTSATPGLLFDVSTESTYFIVDLNGNIVTKVAQLNGGGITAKYILPEALTLSSTSFQMSYLFKDLLVSENSNVFTQTGVQTVIVNFAGVYPSKLNIGEALLLGGGVIQQYDGASPTEQNFHLYPELMTAWIGQLGGSQSVGSYEYQSLYEWTDNQGQTNRSGTSDPLIVPNTLFQLPCSTTSGSTTVIVNPPLSSNTSFPPQFFNIDTGFAINGPGITSGAVVTGRNVGSSGGPFPHPIYQIFISIAATATSAEVNLTATPQVVITGSIDDLSTTMIVNPIGYIPNSMFQVGPTLFLGDTSAVLPGMTAVVNVTNAGSPCLITAVDYNTHAITASPLSSAPNQPETIQIYKQFTGTYTTGSNVVTSVSSYIFPLIAVNDVFLTNDGQQFKITAFNSGAQTINMSLVSSTTITQTANVYFSAGAFLKAGQIIGGTGISANTYIKSISAPTATPSGPTVNVLLSAPVTSTQQNIGYTILNTYCTSLTIPTLRATNKSSVSIVLYRSQSNGTILYRVTPVASPVLNVRTQDFVYITDLVSDFSILGNEQIYTTGGEVENAGAPASNMFTTYKNRAILVPNENPLSWWFSKQVIPGSPVEFSNNFVENIDSRGGAIVAPAAMDDKLILFKSNNIFYVVGEGPTPAGTQNDFSEPQLISSDVGCINPASIVLTPDGLMFQSAKGIYLLSRGISVMYIGDDVEAYNTDTVTSAQLMSAVNQVRFTMLSGVCLVYDYYFKQWAVFTNIAAVDSCLYNNIYNYLTAGGLVNAETPGSFTDNGAFIQMSLTTSWMSLAGLQGFQRVRRMLVLGQYKSPHTLLINVFTDFFSTAVQNISIPVTTAPTPSYEFREHMKVQKCTAIQFQIMDSQSSSFGEGLQLSEITLEVGVKQGANKLSAGKSY